MKLSANLKKNINQALSPYMVEFAPASKFEPVQVIHCWTLQDALTWIKCAFNSDQVTITNKYSGQIAACRYSI